MGSKTEKDKDAKKKRCNGFIKNETYKQETSGQGHVIQTSHTVGQQLQNKTGNNLRKSQLLAVSRKAQVWLITSAIALCVSLKATTMCRCDNVITAGYRVVSLCGGWLLGCYCDVTMKKRSFQSGS